MTKNPCLTFLEGKKQCQKKQNTALSLEIQPHLSLPGNQSSSLSVWSNLTWIPGYPKNSHIWKGDTFYKPTFSVSMFVFWVCVTLQSTEFFFQNFMAWSMVQVFRPVEKRRVAQCLGPVSGQIFWCERRSFIYSPPCENGSPKKNAEL